MEVSLECTSNFKPITVNKQLIYFIAEIIQWIFKVILLSFPLVFRRRLSHYSSEVLNTDSEQVPYTVLGRSLL